MSDENEPDLHHASRPWTITGAAALAWVRG